MNDRLFKGLLGAFAAVLIVLSGLMIKFHPAVFLIILCVIVALVIVLFVLALRFFLNPESWK